MPDNVNFTDGVILSELFKKLGLKPNQCELIRAFIAASKGETYFEVSRAELAQILFSDNETKFRANKERVSDWLEVLQKWQEINGLGLIRLVEEGRREETANGKFAFHKPKYQFVMLEEFVKLLSLSQEHLEAGLDNAISELRGHYQPRKKPKQYHPRHLRRKAENTIFTLLKSIFDYSIQVEENPVEVCQDVLNDAWEKLNEIESEWNEQQKKGEIISKFETLLSENNTGGEEEEGELALKF